MGIYYRYAAAALVLLFCVDSYAVTRKTVNHGQSRASVITGTGASFQTPNGDAAYYGRDYVDEHTAGNRFNANDNPTGNSRDDIRAKQKVPVKPTVTVNPRAAAKAMAGAMRGGVPGAVASAAATAIAAAVGGIIEDNQVRVPTINEVPTDPDAGEYYWFATELPDQRFSSPYAAFVSILAKRDQLSPSITHSIGSTRWASETRFQYCVLQTYARGSVNNNCWFDIYRHGSKCPEGSQYVSSSGACSVTGFGAPSDADWITMEDWAAARDSDFTRDIVRASCEGSNAPARCYEEMSNWGNLQGPASQVGTPQVTTTTTKNPDGTTSTTTTTVQNRYEYNYGPNHYNYTTTTTITENKDGVITETETSDGMPTDNPTHEEASTDYTFNDSEFPEVPSFYEQKYPEGLSGVWHQASADVDHSDFIQFLRGFVPSFSGSCPAFGLGFNIASWANYGTVQFSSICYVLDFVKIILLVTALFTFRKVTFGG